MVSSDIAVVGGGPGGFGAAVAGGRAGKDVVLIEGSDVLGGVGTTSLVTCFANAYWDGERFIIGGIFEELRHRLIGNGGLYQTKGPHHREKFDYEPFHPDALAEEMHVMCEEASVDVKLGEYVTGLSTDDARITSLELADGTEIAAETVIDATGDAMVAHESGVPTRFGRDEDDWVQPLTYCYIVGPVDLEALKEAIPGSVMYDEKTGDEFTSLANFDEIQALLDEALEEGQIDINATQVTSLRSIPGEPQNLAVNFGHVEVADPTDEEQRSRALAEGKRQMREAVAFFRDYVPGMSEIEVVREAEKIGVRESRQIEGLATLTEDDVVSARQFDDVIAQCCFPIDVHRPGEDIHWVELPDGEHYDVPWRSIVPADGPNNVLVAGRCLSADHYAMGSVRQMSSVMAIGEAAGVTAALAVEDDWNVGDVSYEAVQDILTDRGAILT